MKRAQEKSLILFNCIDIRNFAEDKHRVTDDRPFGGGAGMVLKVEPIDKALKKWKADHSGQKNLVIATSAAGSMLTQSKAKSFLAWDAVAIICGHYEGIDQRVLDHLVDEEVSIGPYILTGGEPAAAVIADVVTRLVPGVVGNEESILGEAHEIDGQGTVPQYTRPVVYNDWAVPEVLLGGNHQQITEWREKHRKKFED